MNILILNESPHPHGTTTLLREAFEEGAKSKEHNVTTFHATKESMLRTQNKKVVLLAACGDADSWTR